MDSRAYITALQSAMSATERVNRTESIDGMEVRFEYSPAPGVDMRITTVMGDSPGEQAAIVVYHPASSPPESYPAELPFLAGVSASVWAPADASAGKRSATWSVPDAEAAVAQVLEQSASAGWVAEEEEAALGVDLPVRILMLHKARWSRMVTTAQQGSGSMVMIVDSLEDPGAAG
jgi:hypothetical protein